jgi:hypothetical protein
VELIALLPDHYDDSSSPGLMD